MPTKEYNKQVWQASMEQDPCAKKWIIGILKLKIIGTI